MSAPKILALQFKYFGDAVLMTPALRALREQFPQSEIHLLVPQEVAPLFQHLPWLTRVWAMPRRRGSASNDRGAILSFPIGAKKRLGWAERGGFLGRSFFYTNRVPPVKNLPDESARLVQLLSGWQIPPPTSLAAEIRADAARRKRNSAG